MANATQLPGDLIVNGDLKFSGTLLGLTRAMIGKESSVRYPIKFSDFRVVGTCQPLPNTSATTILGIVCPAFGTDGFSLRTYDVKSAGAKSISAMVEFNLPAEYVAGDSASIVISAGILGAVLADTSATVTVDVRQADRIGGVSSNLYAGAAQSINSNTFSDKTFALTATLLTPGSRMLAKVTIAITDASGAVEVIAAIDAFDLLLNIRG